MRPNGCKKDWSYWLVLIVIIQLLFPSVNCSVDPEEIKAGLDAGSAIAEALESKVFPKVLNSLAKNIGKYLGAIGPAVGLLLAFIPGIESAELQYMKMMMKRIDSRFDQVDQKLNDIERLIQWSSYKQKYMKLETNIRAMAHELTNLYSVPANAVESSKTMFHNDFIHTYDKAGLKLYQAIMQHGAIFSEDLPTTVAKFTEYNLKRTQEIFRGVLSLLMRAAAVELGYLASKKYTAFQDTMKSRWNQRFIAVKGKFEEAERFIKDNYLAQSGKELDTFIREKSNLRADGFTSAVYDFMSKKYFWRDWFVGMFNGYTEYSSVCGGHIRNYKYGKILLASVPKSDEPLHNNLAALKRTIDKKFWWERLGSKYVMILGICAMFQTAGNYHFDFDFAVKAPSNRLYEQHDIFPFGNWAAFFA